MTLHKHYKLKLKNILIQGVFSYDQKYEDIPIFLRKFAQDNDLPVIMFGETEN